MTYPQALHNDHSDFPLAPHNLEITHDMLSPYAKSFQKSSYKSQKLCQTFLPKSKYVVDLRNLRFYMEKGMVLDKVHRVIQFTQSRFLSSYIDKNTELRKNAKSSFEKDLFKLMNNAIFGKTLQNNRKHR